MKRLAKIPTSGFYPLKFNVGAISCGIKKNGSLDLSAITSTSDCSAAGMFTSNIFKAAPVQVDQASLEMNQGRNYRSVLVNSGCANAVTGRTGLKDAETLSALASGETGGNSMCMSTGVIGQLLPMEKIEAGVPKLFKNLGSEHNDWMQLAKGIMTTDTFPKLVSKQIKINNNTYNIAGVAKGAGMISPKMATLLGIVCTDAPVHPEALKSALKSSVDSSFNAITIDGDMSTNDTILALANGAAGGSEITSTSPEFATLRTALAEVCSDLAQLVVRDGEGATKFITIDVNGASSPESAYKIAKSVANSPLVKTAMFGKDANWGRILCAIGYAGEQVDPAKTSVTFVPTDGSVPLKLLVNGEPQQVDEERAAEILNLPDLHIQVELAIGEGSSRVWTCDFSHEYVSINGDYRS